MSLVTDAIGSLLLAPMQAGGVVPRGTRENVFGQIFWVFLILGTIVGIVVIGYMLYNAYKYRADRDEGPDAGDDRPELGELPSGGGGGKKLFLSFSISAVIVISLIIWTYGTLLYVESAPAQAQDTVDVRVVGYQFGWTFQYQDVPGQQGTVNTTNELRVPRGELIRLTVTSSDVFHNFGVPELRVKSDAIPGQTTDTWFRAEETGEYHAQCFELCGAGHSYMEATVVVMEPGAFDEWYADRIAQQRNQSA